MYLHHLNVYFFFGLILFVGATVFFLFQPFLSAIIVAAVFAALFQRPHQFFLKLFRSHIRIASFFTCLFIVFVLVTPVVATLSAVAGEANDFYHSFGEGKTAEIFIGGLVENLRSLPGTDTFFGKSLDEKEILGSIRGLGENFVGILQAAYTSISQFVFFVFILFFTLYYFLIDGKKAISYVMRLSPLRDRHEKLLVEKFVSMSRATMKGTLVIGVIQGAIGWLLFWVVGIPSSVIWGVLMFLFSIIPMVGTGAVWFPAAIILFLSGQVWQGALVLGIGFGVISLIDNILRPKLVGKDTQMHPLLVFFATLGGISLFGIPGFILGPIVVSLFMALWEIYGMEFKKQLDSYNDPSHFPGEAKEL